MRPSILCPTIVMVKSLEVSLGDGRCGHRYLDTRQSSSCNHGGYHGSYAVRGGSTSLVSSHYYSINHEKRVDVGYIGVYRYQISHSYSCIRGDRGIYFDFISFFLLCR